MRITAAAVAVCVAGTGCASRGAAVVEGTLSVLSVAGALESHDCSRELICFDFRAELWAMAAVFGIAAVATWVHADTMEKEQREAQPRVMSRDEVAVWNQDRAADNAKTVAVLSQRIHVAAAGGDCVQVRAIADRLRELDPYGVARASTTDAAIGACFAGGDQPPPGAPPGW